MLLSILFFSKNNFFFSKKNLIFANANIDMIWMKMNLTMM